jgi:hypothetical protein
MDAAALFMVNELVDYAYIGLTKGENFFQFNR